MLGVRGWQCMTACAASLRSTPRLEGTDASVRVVWCSAYAATCRIEHDREVAEEIAQTAVVRYLLDPERVRCAATWAATLARNEVRDRRRSSRRFLVRDLPDQPAEDAQLVNAVRRIALQQALDQVGGSDRELIRSALVGRTHREIAAERGIPVSAVGAYLARASERIRRVLR